MNHNKHRIKTQNHSKLNRSISLPNNQEQSEKFGAKKLNFSFVPFRRRSLSFTDVGDRSNSAAPTRKQPHPFAMQALGLRPGRNNRPPEWPPPDPPPLTPLNIGLAHHASPAAINIPPVWPPRPWWRRTAAPHPTAQIIHVALDTSEVANGSLQVRIAETPARIGWTSTSEDAEQEAIPQEEITIPVAQHASMSEVESNVIRDPTNVVTPAITTARSIEEPSNIINLISRTHSRTFQFVSESQPSAQLNAPVHHSTLSAIPSDEVNSMISLSSEEIQEESTYQVFIVLDTNPDTRIGFRTGETITDSINLFLSYPDTESEYSADPRNE